MLHALTLLLLLTDARRVQMRHFKKMSKRIEGNAIVKETLLTGVRKLFAQRYEPVLAQVRSCTACCTVLLCDISSFLRS